YRPPEPSAPRRRACCFVTPRPRATRARAATASAGCFSRPPSTDADRDGDSQQFCGQAETTVPSVSVTCRINPDREPLRARLASTVTLVLSEPSNAGFSTLRLRKKPGGGPSNDQRSALPALSTSTRM